MLFKYKKVHLFLEISEKSKVKTVTKIKICSFFVNQG